MSYKIILSFLVAALLAPPAHARVVGSYGSDFGDFGELIYAPRCSYTNPAKAECACLEYEEDCVEGDPNCSCIKYHLCPCDPADPDNKEKDLTCECGQKNEKMDDDTVKALLIDKLKPLLKDNLLGEIRIDEDFIEVEILDLIKYPFYTLRIDRKEGRETIPTARGTYDIDPGSKVGFTSETADTPLSPRGKAWIAPRKAEKRTAKNTDGE